MYLVALYIPIVALFIRKDGKLILFHLSADADAMKKNKQSIPPRALWSRKSSAWIRCIRLFIADTMWKAVMFGILSKKKSSSRLAAFEVYVFQVLNF